MTDKPKFGITDHALMRYFERVLGVDLSEIKKKIISEASLAIKLGNGRYPLSEGGTAIVKNNSIVTIVVD